jgi:hypothetical protein
MSFLYVKHKLKQQQNIQFITDDGAAHRYCKALKQFPVRWTSDLMQDLIKSKLLSVKDANIYYQEMINNGFRGKKDLIFI